MTEQKSNIRSPEEQKEILDKEINPYGTGEAPEIKAVLSDEFISADDKKAAEIAAGVAKILMGELDEKLQQRLNQHLAAAEARDNEMKRYMDNQMKWIDEQRLKFEQTKRDLDPDKVSANTAEITKQIRQEIAAESALAQIEFQKKLSDAPKVKLIPQGHPVFIRTSGGGKSLRWEAEILTIPVGTETKQYKLEPGVEYELPDFIVDLYWDKKREQLKRDGLADFIRIGPENKMRNIAEVAEKFPDIGRANVIPDAQTIMDLSKRKGT